MSSLFSVSKDVSCFFFHFQIMHLLNAVFDYDDSHHQLGQVSHRFRRKMFGDSWSEVMQAGCPYWCPINYISNHQSHFIQAALPVELHERTEHLYIFLFSAHYSVVFYFRCSVY